MILVCRFLDASARHDLLEIVEERYGRRSTIIASQPPVRLTPPPRDSAPGGLTTLPRRFHSLYEEIEELERTRIEEALAAANGIRVRAAELLGMPLRTLSTKIKQYGLGSKAADKDGRAP